MIFAIQYVRHNLTTSPYCLQSPFYRCSKPELKSLALGIHTLATRTLGENFHLYSVYLLCGPSLKVSLNVSPMDAFLRDDIPATIEQTKI